MTHKPLDFVKVEELRVHMLMPVGGWAKILGVSRMTYYKWVTGKAQIRFAREITLRARIRQLLTVLADGWPTPEGRGLDPDSRVSKLLALLDQPQ